jgi:hypothetical protein
MHTMATVRNDAKCRCVLLLSCLALGLGLQGCARSEPPHPEAGASAGSKQRLPFHADAARVSASAAATSGTVPAANAANGLPFRHLSHAEVLPAGTLLTVRLENSLSAAHVYAGDAFTASVADPLVVDGDILIDRGTEVTGRIQDARFRPGSGYVELTLNTIRVDGTVLGLQTSSLFVRATVRELTVSAAGSGYHRESVSARVQKGRRLTFRLTAPITLSSPLPQDDPPSPSTATE